MTAKKRTRENIITAALTLVAVVAFLLIIKTIALQNRIYAALESSENTQTYTESVESEGHTYTLLETVTENTANTRAIEKTPFRYDYQQLVMVKTVDSVDKSAETKETEPTTEALKEYNGIFEGDTITTGELTFYCVCMKCCGKLDGVTASGIKIKNGMELEQGIAGCNWLPLNSVIEIDGVEYIIADRGGKAFNRVGRLDIFEPLGHQQALINGRQKNVEIKVVSLP